MRMLAPVIALAALTVAALADDEPAAQVTRKDRTLYVVGYVGASMRKQIEQHYAEGTVTTVDLDSPGGNGSTAMQIGRLLRKNSATVVVRKGKRCSSACVMILIGGSNRYIAGRVGVHSPSYPATKVMDNWDVHDYRLWQRRLRRAGYGSIAEYWYEKKYNYVIEMGISLKLIEVMMATPAEKMHWLTREEIEDFGLHNEKPERHWTVPVKVVDPPPLPLIYYSPVPAESWRVLNPERKQS